MGKLLILHSWIYTRGKNGLAYFARMSIKKKISFNGFRLGGSLVVVSAAVRWRHRRRHRRVVVFVLRHGDVDHRKLLPDFARSAVRRDRFLVWVILARIFLFGEDHFHLLLVCQRRKRGRLLGQWAGWQLRPGRLLRRHRQRLRQQWRRRRRLSRRRSYRRGRGQGSRIELVAGSGFTFRGTSGRSSGPNVIKRFTAVIYEYSY